MRFEIQRESVFLTEALWLFGIFFLITAAGWGICWWSKYRLGLRSVFAYLLLWGVVFWGVNRTWFQSREDLSYNKSGFLYGDNVHAFMGASAYVDYVVQISDRDFKLECGRHIAPRAVLEALYARQPVWIEATTADGDPELHDLVELPIEVRVADLSRYEHDVFEAWLNVWANEVEHLAIVQLAEDPDCTLKIDSSSPAWTTYTSGDLTMTSFDAPPRTEIVRRAMREYIRAHPRTPQAGYFRRVLDAAKELDARTNLKNGADAESAANK